MKKTTLFIQQKMMLFCLLVFSLTASAQEFIVTLGNAVMTTDQLEVDVLLTIPASGARLASCSAGINFNSAIINGGTPCTVPSNQGCQSWILIPGTIAPEIQANGGLYSIITTVRNINLSQAAYGHLRIVQISRLFSQVDLLAGTYRIGRFRFTNTVPWAADADPELWLSPTNAGGATNTTVSSAPYGSSVVPTTVSTTTTATGKYVTLGYTQGNPYRRPQFSSPQLATVSNEVAPILTAYPNPFQDAFKLNMTAASAEMVQIQVYDMLGKRIDTMNVEANAANNFEIGRSYPSGFYNLKISQGDKTQSIRMIKQ